MIAVRNEKTLGVQSQPKNLKLTIVALCLCAITQGWIESVSNAANLEWPSLLEIEVNNWNRLPSSATFLVVRGLSVLVSKRLKVLLKQRSILLLSGCLCLAGSIGTATALYWEHLVVSRVMREIGHGLLAAQPAVIAAETLPSHLRYVLRASQSTLVT